MTGSAGGSRCVGLSGKPGQQPAAHRRPAAPRRRALPGRCRPVRASRVPPGCAAVSPAKQTRVSPGRHSFGSLEHLDDRQVTVDLEHEPVPHLPGPSSMRADSSQPDARHTADHEQRPRSSATSRVLERAERRGRSRWTVTQQPSRVASAWRPMPAGPADVRRGAAPAQRAARGRSPSPRSPPRVPRRRRARRHRSTTARTASSSAAPLAARAEGVVWAQRILLQHPFAQQPPGQHDHALGARQRPDPDQIGEGAEPVGLGEQRADRARGARAHAGSPCAACHAPSASASRENDPDQATAG